jgi:hypothetical protein
MQLAGARTLVVDATVLGGALTSRLRGDGPGWCSPGAALTGCHRWQVRLRPPSSWT